ncbi:MAG: ATP-binding protein [Lachnospiraceae bacterium]|nr:ATP-binding protein [Lachnospiraceae bacterium]
MLKRNEKLIKSKLWQYLIPSIMTNMALQIGNVVDTILVGNILGAKAMSAVQIGGTIMLLIQIPGYMLGIGGSIMAGNRLGKRDVKGASNVFSASLLTSLIAGIILMALAFFSAPISAFLTGGQGALTKDVTDVVRVSFLGTPILSAGLVMINFMAVDNNPSLSTVYVVTSNVLNLLADYFLLKYTKIGPAGSSLSTFIGYGVALIVVILYVRSSKRMLSLRISFEGLKDAFITGVPAMLSIVCEMIRNSVMNIMILRLIGDDAVAIYTICLNLVMVCELFLGGIIEAMNMIGGVVYGEKDYFGLRSLSKYILRYSYTVLFVLTIILVAFTRQSAAMFGVTDASLLDASVPALRLFLIALPGYVFNRFFIAYYQTTEKTVYSNLITILQFCGVLLPAVFAFVKIAIALGLNTLNAAMLGMAAGEVFTAIIMVIVVNITNKRAGLLCIPKDVNEDVLDMSVSPDAKEASRVPREIIAFCKDKIDSTPATQIAIAAEEMAVNAITYGGNSLSSIDVMLCITDDSVLLRLRDNGIPFDPTNYEYDDKNYEYSGIELVRRITNRITYLRTLDFNNTTLEIDRENLKAEAQA